MSALNNEDPIREAPNLSAIPKMDPFVVPEGFFEHFPHRVQARIVQRCGNERWRPILWPALAASTLILILLSIQLVDQQGQDTGSPALADEAILHGVGPAEEDLLWLEEEDLYSELAWSEDVAIRPGEGFSQDELGAYLMYADIPLSMIAETP